MSAVRAKAATTRHSLQGAHAKSHGAQPIASDRADHSHAHASHPLNSPPAGSVQYMEASNVVLDRLGHAAHRDERLVPPKKRQRRAEGKSAQQHSTRSMSISHGVPNGFQAQARGGLPPHVAVDSAPGLAAGSRDPAALAVAARHGLEQNDECVSSAHADAAGAPPQHAALHADAVHDAHGDQEHSAGTARMELDQERPAADPAVLLRMGAIAPELGQQLGPNMSQQYQEDEQAGEGVAHQEGGTGSVAVSIPAAAGASRAKAVAHHIAGGLLQPQLMLRQMSLGPMPGSPPGAAGSLLALQGQLQGSRGGRAGDEQSMSMGLGAGINDAVAETGSLDNAYGVADMPSHLSRAAHGAANALPALGGMAAGTAQPITHMASSSQQAALPELPSLLVDMSEVQPLLHQPGLPDARRRSTSPLGANRDGHYAGSGAPITYEVLSAVGDQYQAQPPGIAQAEAGPLGFAGAGAQGTEEQLMQQAQRRGRPPGRGRGRGRGRARDTAAAAPKGSSSPNQAAIDAAGRGFPAGAYVDSALAQLQAMAEGGASPGRGGRGRGRGRSLAPGRSTGRGRGRASGASGPMHSGSSSGGSRVPAPVGIRVKLRTGTMAKILKGAGASSPEGKAAAGAGQLLPNKQAAGGVTRGSTAAATGAGKGSGHARRGRGSAHASMHDQRQGQTDSQQLDSLSSQDPSDLSDGLKDSMLGVEVVGLPSSSTQSHSGSAGDGDSQGAAGEQLRRALRRGGGGGALGNAAAAMADGEGSTESDMHAEASHSSG